MYKTLKNQLLTVALVLSFFNIYAQSEDPNPSFPFWKTQGNLGLNPALHFMGTADSADVVLRSNNTERMRIIASGNVGIGTPNPLDRLHVTGSIRMVDGNQSAGRIMVSNANGTGRWVNASSVLDTTGWKLIGNAGTNANNNFIGTTDNNAFVIRTNNALRAKQSAGRTFSLGMDYPVAGAQNFIDPWATLEVNGNGSNNGDFILNSIDNSGNCSYIISARARGTFAAPLIVNNGDRITTFEAWAYDGTGYKTAAGILMRIDSVPAANSLPANITFHTSSVGSAPGISAGTSERVRIDRNGNVGIGNANPQARLVVSNLVDSSAIMRIHNSSNSAFTRNWIGFSADNTFGTGDINDRARIGMEVQSTGPGELFFTTGGYNGQQERMRINQNGNIGLGIRTPNILIDASLNKIMGTSATSVGQHDVTNRGVKVSFGSVVLTNTNEFVGMRTEVAAGTNACGNSGDIRFDTWECNTSLSREVMRINGRGNVGIGTTTPTQAKLVVNGTMNNTLTYGFLNLTGVTGVGSGTVGYSIYASGRIAATEFNAYSDARIKNITGLSNSEADLQTLASIEITDYKFIDTIGKDNRNYKKVIAQQVEKVYPQAVSTLTDVIPDIYKLAEMENGYIKIENRLKAGDVVKLIFDNGETLETVITADAKGFSVNNKANKKVFVYGKQVDDFRTVDYEALTTLNISATQELLKLMKTQDNTIEQLQAKQAMLEAEIASIKKLISSSIEP